MGKKAQKIIIGSIIAWLSILILFIYEYEKDKNHPKTTVKIETTTTNFPNVVYIDGLDMDDYLYNVDTYFKSIIPKKNVLGVLITTGTKFNGRHKDDWYTSTNLMIDDILSLHKTILMQPASNDAQEFNNMIRESASLLSRIKSDINKSNFENDESFRYSVFEAFEEYEFIIEKLIEGEF